MQPTSHQGLAVQHITTRPEGTIEHLTLHGQPCDFRDDNHRGPSWHVHDGTDWQAVPTESDGAGAYHGQLGEVEFRIGYTWQGEALCISAGITNRGRETFRPQHARLKLGLSTWMERYPDWESAYFPTQLRCEPTHFWGYFMRPDGAILGIASPDPVASWSMDWSMAHYGDFGHRIYTCNFDLLQAPPLPPRHPQEFSELAPGAAADWRLYLCPIASLEAVPGELARWCQAPVFAIPQTTVRPGDRATVVLHAAAQPTLERGGHPVSLQADGPGRWRAEIPCQELGPVQLRARSNERHSDALLYVRPTWSWYLGRGREAALKYPVQADTHLECWMGLTTILAAAAAIPDPALDAQCRAVVDQTLQMLLDPQSGLPRKNHARVCNTALLAHIVVKQFELDGDMAHLQTASDLASLAMKYQSADGALRGRARGDLGDVHYTSVCYPARAIMDVMLALRDRPEAHWQAAYQKLLHGMTAAMDDLVRRRGDMETEGELTFEDGMISCTYLQLAFFALHFLPPDARGPYVEVALLLARQHRCLELRLLPDARMQGATLRFWEAQYDVHLWPNMFNAPHGWTSWKTYGSWYLYQLTGDPEWLQETINTLGSSLQVVDLATGDTRWGFVPDPWVKLQVFRPRPPLDEPIIGECYVPMIADRCSSRSCDNDVHEHFKCLAEVALPNACLHQRPDDSPIAWNCHARHEADRLVLVADEPQMVRHIYLHLVSHTRLQYGEGGPVIELTAGRHLLDATSLAEA